MGVVGGGSETLRSVDSVRTACSADADPCRIEADGLTGLREKSVLCRRTTPPMFTVGRFDQHDRLREPPRRLRRIRGNERERRISTSDRVLRCAALET
jgi:hypothetical protein